MYVTSHILHPLKDALQSRLNCMRIQKKMKTNAIAEHLSKDEEYGK
jgi:hypothetical protein